MVKPVSKSTYLLLIGGGYLLAALLFIGFFVTVIGASVAAQNSGNQDAAGAAVAGRWA